MKKLRSKMFLWLTISLFVLLAVSYSVFRIFNPSVGFTYYEPSYLPQGISITSKRISIDKYAPTQIEQNFRTEDWVYSIRENKATELIGTAEQNYDEKSVKPTCSLLSTAAKTEYRLCHWIDYGTIGVQEVKFIKEGTFIDAQIPTKSDEPIRVEEISRFVDSFKKKTTTGLPVLRSNGP